MNRDNPFLLTIDGFTKGILDSLTVELPAHLGAPDMKRILMHGTTIGALRVEDRSKVVAFSDGKISMETIAFGLDMDKCLQVDDFSCLQISGAATMGVQLGRVLRSYVAVKQNSDQKYLSVSAKVGFIRRGLMQLMGMAAQGAVVMPIFSTFDKGYSDEARIYLFSPDGSHTHENRKVFGSGFHAGNAALEDRYDELMSRNGGVTLDEGLALARRILEKTAKDDNASGGQRTIKVIDADGVHIIEGGK